MNKPKLACPFCHSIQYIFIYNQKSMCYCTNCNKKASIEFFEREGEKWDNYETENAM